MATTKIPFGFKYQMKQARHDNPIGSKVVMEHTGHMGLDGKRKLLKDKQVMRYEMIQASREQTEIERIVKRALEGDPTVLNAVTGQYADITGAPKSLAEAQQIMINAKRDFGKLDKETRELFNNNVEEFIAQAGSKEWMDKLGITARLEKEKAVKEAKAKFEKDTAAAMANLAGQAAITNVEVNES